MLNMFAVLRYFTNEITTLRPEQNGWHFQDNNSNAFAFMNSSVFWFKFHRSLSPRVQFKKMTCDILSIIASGNNLSSGQHQAINWSRDDLSSLRNAFQLSFIPNSITVIQEMHLKLPTIWLRPQCASYPCICVWTKKHFINGNKTLVSNV